MAESSNKGAYAPHSAFARASRRKGMGQIMDIHIGLHTVPQLHKLTPINAFHQQADCPIVKCSAMPPYELELENHRVTESTQAKAVTRGGMVVRQMEESIQQKDILFKECEHRLLNGLQLIASLLTIQSRAIENAGGRRAVEDSGQPRRHTWTSPSAFARLGSSRKR